MSTTPCCVGLTENGNLFISNKIKQDTEKFCIDNWKYIGLSIGSIATAVAVVIATKVSPIIFVAGVYAGILDDDLLKDSKIRPIFQGCALAGLAGVVYATSLPLLTTVVLCGLGATTFRSLLQVCRDEKEQVLSVLQNKKLSLLQKGACALVASAVGTVCMLKFRVAPLVFALGATLAAAEYGCARYQYHQCATVIAIVQRCLAALCVIQPTAPLASMITFIVPKVALKVAQ